MASRRHLDSACKKHFPNPCPDKGWRSLLAGPSNIAACTPDIAARRDDCEEVPSSRALISLQFQ